MFPILFFQCFHLFFQCCVRVRERCVASLDTSSYLVAAQVPTPPHLTATDRISTANQATLTSLGSYTFQAFPNKRNLPSYICTRPVHKNLFLALHVTWHRPPGTWKSRCQVPAPGTWHLAHDLNLASGVSLKRAFKMQFRNAYFRSLVHPSQKLWPKPD